MPENYLDLSEILKTGAVTATDVALNGELTPKQGRAFANAIVDDAGLLKHITVDITKKLLKDRSALSTSKGMLVRHVAGKALSDTQLKKLGVVGARLNMTNGVTLQINITDEALDDNQDNPNFEKEQFEAATTAFRNDLVYLAETTAPMCACSPKTTKRLVCSSQARCWSLKVESSSRKRVSPPEHSWAHLTRIWCLVSQERFTRTPHA